MCPPAAAPMLCPGVAAALDTEGNMDPTQTKVFLLMALMGLLLAMQIAAQAGGLVALQ
jgi:hypothetical protein